MTTIPTPQAAPSNNYGVFEKTARFIGDLDHELYNDPAQGQAWNEASAVGFQMTLIGALIGSGIMFLIGGAALSAAAVALITFTGIAAITTIGYATSHGVNIRFNRSDFLRPRSLLIAVGLGLHGAAIINNTPASASTIYGLVCGFGLISGVFCGIAIAAARKEDD